MSLDASDLTCAYTHNSHCVKITVSSYVPATSYVTYLDVRPALSMSPCKTSHHESPSF